MTRTRPPITDPFAPTPAPELRVPLTLRLPPALHDSLAALAAGNRRSLNAQILELLYAGLPKEKSK